MKTVPDAATASPPVPIVNHTGNPNPNNNNNNAKGSNNNNTSNAAKTIDPLEAIAKNSAPGSTSAAADNNNKAEPPKPTTGGKEQQPEVKAAVPVPTTTSPAAPKTGPSPGTEATAAVTKKAAATSGGGGGAPTADTKPTAKWNPVPAKVTIQTECLLGAFFVLLLSTDGENRSRFSRVAEVSLCVGEGRGDNAQYFRLSS